MSEIVHELDKEIKYSELPLMTLRDVVIFPGAIMPLYVGRVSSIKAVEKSLNEFDRWIFLVTQKNPEIEIPQKQELYEIGIVAKILQLLRLPDGTIKVLFEGIKRARWKAEDPLFDKSGKFPIVSIDVLEDIESPSDEVETLIRLTKDALKKFVRASRRIAKDALKLMLDIRDAGKLADAIIPHLRVGFEKKQEILEELDPVKRLELVYGFLVGEIEYLEIEAKINDRVRQQIEVNQKNYYLNEQLKAIHKEMGLEEDPFEEVESLIQQLEEKNMPEEAKEKALAEIKKLKQMPPSSAEYTVVRNYVDCILDLPWDEIKATEIDIEQAAKILDEDHYGLEKPKERILEYLAVQKLVDKVKGPILCFVGPPGVGKTSLARSIARAMDRDFVRISLGGVRDEAEIRGHRRTYVGALPGKIILSLRKKKYNNPVMCLDEVDKMSTDFRGDPSAALLEVLDPEQNYAFNDHYLDLNYDLSNVFFITTANTLQTIPWALRDRMEIIHLPGYLEDEKVKISKYFLIPKQMERHGIKDKNVTFSDGAVIEIIRRYTREAGVRNLEREIASVCRKVAKKLVEGKDLEKKITVTKASIPTYLGVPRFRYGEKEEKAQVGLATGLAWTELGGELLMIEVAIMDGTGKIEITGKIGEVMQESAKAAFSYVRTRSELLGLKQDFYKDVDIHIHVPEGATPKDGPSAGITMATALVSALLNIPVNNDVAMTGEITLRGRILPIGGLREKLLAAHRGMVSKVIIPKENSKDLKEVPNTILKDLEIIEVEHMDEVLPIALKDIKPKEVFKTSKEIIPISYRLRKDEVSHKTQ
ncbi:endopeptidase La [Desulfothermus sp.]